MHDGAMRQMDGRILLSTSDLINHRGCAHRTNVELARLRGELALNEVSDPMAELLAARGEAHERNYVEMLRTRGLDVVSINSGRGSLDDVLAAAAATVEAMVAGAEAIEQAVFLEDGWTARADVLLRIDRTTMLGSHGYEVADTKLAGHRTEDAEVQLWDYSRHVARIQGVEPISAHLVLGDGTVEVVELAEVTERMQPAALRRELRRRVDAEVATYPDPEPACGHCPWLSLCDARRRTDNDLSLLPGMRRAQRTKLMAAGIRTVLDLSLYEPNSFAGIGDRPFSAHRQHARLQERARQRGHPVFELLPPEPSRGLELLPVAHSEDLFIDFESDPWWGTGGLEYMLGFVAVTDNKPSFDVLWAHDREDECRLYVTALDRILGAWRRSPGMHVYHYGNYEVAALKRLELRHAQRGMELTQLLEAGVFVDLQRVVQGALVTSLPGYSLKDIEFFFMAKREGDVLSAGASLVAYETAVADTDPVRRQRQFDAIEAYNKIDCVTTWKLTAWLLQQQRATAGATHAQEP